MTTSLKRTSITIIDIDSSTIKIEGCYTITQRVIQSKSKPFVFFSPRSTYIILTGLAGTAGTAATALSSTRPFNLALRIPSADGFSAYGDEFHVHFSKFERIHMEKKKT